MLLMKSQWSEIDNWFVLILKERFGVDFILNRFDQCVELTVDGYANKIVINAIESEFYQFANTHKLNCTHWSAKSEGFIGVIDDALYLPCVGKIETALFVRQEENNYCLNFDFLGLCYWVLNRLEEIKTDKLDKFQRFDPYYSHAYIHGYLERPIVDEWMDIFSQLIQKVWGNISLKKHEFRFEVSHDVDRPTRYGFKDALGFVKSVAADLKQGFIQDAFFAPYVKLNGKRELHPRDPYNIFNWIFDVSKRLNIKNAFYFISGGVSAYDADYKLTDVQIQKLMKEIANNGHEIGLHPSFDTFLNPEQLKKEFNELKQQCDYLNIKQPKWGGRMHYLRWSHTETLQAWEDAGLNYDSTLGYSAMPGFRCGTCYEYTVFNPLIYQTLKLKEHPLIVMEVMLVQDLSLTKEQKENAKSKIVELIHTVKKVNGNFTFLWHNSTLRNPLSRQLYEEVLTVLADLRT